MSSSGAPPFSDQSGGSISRWLRLEGAAFFMLAGGAYAMHEAGWLLFILLFFAPDLSMLGYLRNPRSGALLYNLFHTYLAPATLVAAGLLLGQGLAVAGALIWFAHIGFDRMLGYGLKLQTGFGDTHLGPLRALRRLSA